MKTKKLNHTNLCVCGHRRKDHVRYINGERGANGSRLVCTKDNCHLWNYCDLTIFPKNKQHQTLIQSRVRRSFSKNKG